MCDCTTITNRLSIAFIFLSVVFVLDLFWTYFQVNMIVVHTGAILIGVIEVSHLFCVTTIRLIWWSGDVHWAHFFSVLKCLYLWALDSVHLRYIRYGTFFSFTQSFYLQLNAGRQSLPWSQQVFNNLCTVLPAYLHLVGIDAKRFVCFVFFSIINRSSQWHCLAATYILA